MKYLAVPYSIRFILDEARHTVKVAKTFENWSASGANLHGNLKSAAGETKEDAQRMLIVLARHYVNTFWAVDGGLARSSDFEFYYDVFELTSPFHFHPSGRENTNL